jgi:hypothetical protein
MRTLITGLVAALALTAVVSRGQTIASVMILDGESGGRITIGSM